MILLDSAKIMGNPMFQTVILEAGQRTSTIPTKNKGFEVVPIGLRRHGPSHGKSRSITRESRGNHAGITPPPQSVSLHAIWVGITPQSRPNHAQSRPPKTRKFGVFRNFLADFSYFSLIFGCFPSIFEGLGVEWSKFG